MNLSPVFVAIAVVGLSSQGTASSVTTSQLVSSAPEIVGGKSHPCYRKCLPGLTFTCVYNFTISEHGTMALQCGDCPNNLTHCGNVGCIQAGGLIRVSSVVNQRIPGPGIQVCLGDLVVVNVHNGFMSKVVTIHWHGLHQTQTPHMDGVPFLTQCPIQPHTDFTYKFVADTPGTHMWHSHIGFEESDGLFGPLVVRRPLTSDPSSSYYDYDLAEHYIIVWHWYSQPSSHHLTTALHMNGSVYGAGLIINGKGGLENFGAGWKETYSKMPRETFTISKGKRYRFRLAFNSAVYCPVQMSIDQHKLTVIASESASFQPVEGERILLLTTRASWVNEGLNLRYLLVRTEATARRAVKYCQKPQ